LLLRRVVVGYGDVAAVVTAALGAWLLWSQLSTISKLSWFYDHAEYVQSLRESSLPNPDYDLGSLPWKTAAPEVFDFRPGGAMHLTTNAQPYGYQAFAAVDTNGARLADIQFEADVESGGMTIGLLESGKWIVSNASRRRGRFADANSVELGYHRSITVVIANNNPDGQSRLTVKWLRLYLRK
jgi:hypothetical protein